MANPYKLIMLVDEDEIDNIINQKIIESNNFSERILVFQAGQDALDYLAKNVGNDAELPEIIFLDINMPIMDGITLIKQLRSNAKYRFAPIVMLTTESEMEKKMEARAAGAASGLPFPKAGPP